MEPCIAFVILLVSFIPVYYILSPLQLKAAISDRTPIIWGLIGSCILGYNIILIYIDGPANSFAILAYLIPSIVLYKAAISKINGAWIIISGYMLSIVLFVFQAVSLERFISVTYWAYPFGVCAIVCSLAVYLAYQFVVIKTDNMRQSQELEQARQLQLSMLPDAIPSVPNLEIAWHMEIATEIGGDYYDYKLEDDGTLINYWADQKVKTSMNCSDWLDVLASPSVSAR